jgi:hypothetical protein
MKTFLLMAALAVSSTAFAADVNVQRKVLGSGTPGQTGLENAKVVNSTGAENNILHAPQYMPNHPTAATIWPRVVEVPCVKIGADLKCEGYNWNPSMGRGEYLFVTPQIIEPVAPVVVTKTVEKIVPVIVERKVFVEVPVKRKKE